MSLGIAAALLFGASLPAMAAEKSCVQLPNNSEFTGIVVNWNDQTTHEGNVTMSVDGNGLVAVQYTSLSGETESAFLAVDESRSSDGRIMYWDPYEEWNGGAVFDEKSDGSYEFIIDLATLTIKGRIELVEPELDSSAIDGTYKINPDHDYDIFFPGKDPHVGPLDDLLVVVADNVITVTAKSNGKTYVYVGNLIAINSEHLNYQFTNGEIMYEYSKQSTHIWFDEDYQTARMDLFNNPEFGLDFVPLIKVEQSSDQPFTGTKIISGTTFSKTGEYMAVVGGSISGTFPAGRNQVSGVAGQPLSIFLLNQTNGATRTLGANTINSMYITVANGEITKIEIEGRAQTSPGNYDTYSLVISY